MIKLTILSENRQKCNFEGEGGLSILINAFNNVFLLDTGYSDLFLKNAEKLNLNLNNIKKVVCFYIKYLANVLKRKIFKHKY